MDKSKETSLHDAVVNVNESVKAAAQISKMAEDMKEEGINFDLYEHRFKKPFDYEGVAHEKLTFDWTRLTGRDSLDIEDEILRRKKKTLVNAAYSGDYLTGMAVRACTYRGEDGRRLGLDAFETMPLPELQKICSWARFFLIASGL